MGFTSSISQAVTDFIATISFTSGGKKDMADKYIIEREVAKEAIEAAIGTPVDTAASTGAETDKTLFGWIKGIFAMQSRTVSQGTAINVTSLDYEDAEGFFVYVPAGFTGSIVATPLNGTEMTISSYSTDCYLRDCLFKAVSTDTDIKTGLEAWK